MGTTSEKLTYLNVTKQKLKQAINNIGGEVTDETTFREYVNQLENAYDRLPKTEFEEGESVTLENTLKGKLDFQDGKVGFGKASQGSTQGYQLIKEANFETYTHNGVTFTQLENGSIKVNGTASGEATVNLLTGTNSVANNENNITLVANQTYTINAEGSTSTIRIIMHTSSYGNVRIAGGGKTTFTETQDVNISAVRISVSSGTTANNVIIYPMLEKGSTAHDYEPYTGGYSSPSPNWEQQVKCVAGRNILKDSGWERKTAWNETQIQDSTTRIMSDYIEVDEHLNYYATIQSTSYCFGNVVLYNANKVQFATYYNAVSQVINGTRSIGLKFPTNTKYARFVVRNTDNTSEVTLDELATIKPMLEQSTQAHPYTPYNTIEEVVSGKNKFNLGSSTYEKYGIAGTYSGSKMKVNGTTTGSTNVFEPNAKSIGVFKAGNYVLSSDYTGSVNLNGHAHLMYLRSSNNLSSNDNILTQFSPSVTNASKQFSLTEDTELFMQWYANSSGIAYDNLEVSIQIEQGNQATTYEPYITPTSYQLSLGDIELCKIGNYQDYIYKSEGKWYVHKEINKVVFTGASSESWEFQSTYTGFFTHSYAVATGYSPAKSNYFINSEDTVWVDERFGFNSNGATLWIRDTSNFSSLSNFTTWLATHNLEIYYALATPTDTEITDETLINQLNAWYNAHSLNGTTIVTSNGNLPMIIKVRGLKGE